MQWRTNLLSEVEDATLSVLCLLPSEIQLEVPDNHTVDSKVLFTHVHDGHNSKL